MLTIPMDGNDDDCDDDDCDDVDVDDDVDEIVDAVDNDDTVFPEGSTSNFTFSFAKASKLLCDLQWGSENGNVTP